MNGIGALAIKVTHLAELGSSFLTLTLKTSFSVFRTSQFINFKTTLALNWRQFAYTNSHPNVLPCSPLLNTWETAKKKLRKKLKLNSINLAPTNSFEGLSFWQNKKVNKEANPTLV